LHQLTKLTAVEQGRTLVDLVDTVFVPAIQRYRRDHGLEDRPIATGPITRTKSIS
jgi:hypothetical protein